MTTQKPFRGMQINKAHPLAQGLVGCWVMNEQTGDKIFDLSGNGNLGTNDGADWTTDGLMFVRSNTDKVTTPLLIDPREQNSVVLKTTWTSLSQDNLHGCRNVGGDRFYIGIDENYTFIGVGDSFHYDSNAVPHDMSVGEPYLVSFVIDGSTARYYVGGVQKDSLSYSASAAITNTFVVGDLGGTLGYPVNAKVEFMYVYDRAISTDEILWLNREPYAMFQQPISPASLYYEAPTGVTIPVLMHHYNQMMRA